MGLFITRSDLLYLYLYFIQSYLHLYLTRIEMDRRSQVQDYQFMGWMDDPTHVWMYDPLPSQAVIDEPWVAAIPLVDQILLARAWDEIPHCATRCVVFHSPPSSLFVATLIAVLGNLCFASHSWSAQVRSREVGWRGISLPSVDRVCGGAQGPTISLPAPDAPLISTAPTVTPSQPSDERTSVAFSESLPKPLASILLPSLRELPSASTSQKKSTR